jgi:hypothetical protein
VLAEFDCRLLEAEDVCHASALFLRASAALEAIVRVVEVASSIANEHADVGMQGTCAHVDIPIWSKHVPEAVARGWLVAESANSTEKIVQTRVGQKILRNEISTLNKALAVESALDAVHKDCVSAFVFAMVRLMVMGPGAKASVDTEGSSAWSQIVCHMTIVPDATLRTCRPLDLQDLALLVMDTDAC